MLFAAALIWGFAFVAQKAATTVPPFTICASRGIIAVLALTVITVIFDKLGGNKRVLFSKKGIDLSRRELIGGIVCGSILFIATALQQTGLADTDAGKASFITALYVVIVPILGIFMRRPAPINALVGVVIAVIGFYLICIKKGVGIAPSDLLLTLCALCFALQIIAIDVSVKGSDGIRLSLIQFSTMTVLSFICSLIFEGIDSYASVSLCLPEVLYLGIGSSGIAYTLQILGQKGTHPAVASIILSMESVFGSVAAAIVLGERMLTKEYIGCAIVLVAVIISQLDTASVVSFSKRIIARKNAGAKNKTDISVE